MSRFRLVWAAASAAIVLSQTASAAITIFTNKPLYDAQITGGFLMVADNQCTVMVEGLAKPAGA